MKTKFYRVCDYVYKRFERFAWAALLLPFAAIIIAAWLFGEAGYIVAQIALYVCYVLVALLGIALAVCIFRKKNT